MEDRGFEPTEKIVGITDAAVESGAESGARGAREASIDSRLVAVIGAWPTIPADAKAAILAIVEAAVKRTK